VDDETNGAKVYEHVRANKVKFSIRQIKRVEYDHKSELEREEYRVIQAALRQGIMLYNEVGVKVGYMTYPGLKQGEYKAKKKENIGSISVVKDAVVVRWSVGGKRKTKKIKFRFGKKRTKGQAMDAATVFQTSL
jgi:hypothetical protein